MPGDADEGNHLTTVEIESILGGEELAALLEAAEGSGQLRQAELTEVLEPLELDPLELEAVYSELDRQRASSWSRSRRQEKEKEAAAPAARRRRSPPRRRRTRCSSSCARPGATRC